MFNPPQAHSTTVTDRIIRDEIFDKARLVNCALMAKIHTVEWTPAILAHPALKVSLPPPFFLIILTATRQEDISCLRSDGWTSFPASKAIEEVLTCQIDWNGSKLVGACWREVDEARRSHLKEQRSHQRNSRINN